MVKEVFLIKLIKLLDSGGSEICVVCGKIICLSICDLVMLIE